MDVSFIIPLYNSELYISRCLNSIIKQPFKGDFEIIVVNDYSTDDSLSIVEEYSNKYSNIRIINHSSNQKVSIARKNGVLNATGKYIWFVDSDDWIEEGSLQKIYNYADAGSFDLLLFKAFKVYNTKIKKTYITTPSFHRGSKYYTSFRGALWAKLIRRNLITEDFISFQKSIFTGEDMLLAMELLYKSTKIGFFNSYCYNYYCNNFSITNTTNFEENIENLQHIIRGMFSIICRYSENKDLHFGVFDVLYKKFIIEILNTPINVLHNKKTLVNSYISEINIFIKDNNFPFKQFKFTFYKGYWFLMLLFSKQYKECVYFLKKEITKKIK